MGTTQREIRSLVVIKERGLPLHAVVTFGAASDFGLRELLSMNVFVAVLAKRRSRFEINVDEFGLEIGRFMAVDTGRGAMRP